MRNDAMAVGAGRAGGAGVRVDARRVERVRDNIHTMDLMTVFQLVIIYHSIERTKRDNIYDASRTRS